MNSNQIINLLTIILGFMIFILFVLCGIYVMLKLRNNKFKIEKPKGFNNNKNDNKIVNKKTNSSTKQYNKKSIFEFMEFDNIQDNMIIQKNGKRFLMVIECQGINYDLMSGIEKNSVEQGFLQFLNTLRYPIQIYVQTRSVNLTESISNYQEKIDDISKQYASKQAEYNMKVRSGNYNEDELAMEKYELVRQKNLYEYGIDIVKNTERLSLNKNILSKHYYIIVPYYAEEIGSSEYAKEEIINIAFSELYTKAQAIISSLAVCDINSKILNSTELAELLYIAYNRDEAEVFNLQNALSAGYEDLYSTAPNVFDKRMKELDIKIEEDSIKRANEIVNGVVEESEKQKRAKRKEQEMEKLIDQMAMSIIEENRSAIGNELADKSIDVLKKKRVRTKKSNEEIKEKKSRKKGGEVDG